MRIKSIKIARNVKNLHLDNVPMKRRTLVHGPNNWGKTNLLLLLKVAFKSKDSPPGEDEPKFSIEGYDETRGMLKRKGMDVVPSGSVTIAIDCFSAAFKDARKVVYDGSSSNTQSVELKLTFEARRPGTFTRVDSIKIGSKVAHSEKKPAKDKLLDALQKWMDQELVDSVVYVPNSRIRDGRPVPLDHDAGLDPIENLENAAFRFKNDPGIDPRIPTQLAERLEAFFDIPEFRTELSVTPRGNRDDEEGPSPRVGIGLRTTDADWFPMSQVGTGVQQVFSILSQILVHPNASVALIEEFETSLSQPNKNRMLELFLQMTNDTDGPLRQIVATSHNIFRPSQPEFISVGAERHDGGPLVGFREWGEQDWKNFIGSE